jgi:GNAT superfamily N-acetyltransferase
MIELELQIEPGLTYTEETGRLYRSLAVRDCFLWKEGLDEPISGLNLFSFRQRFGALSVPGEGIGGVETMPRFRRQGFMSLLMRKALEGVSRRVKVAYVSDAIEDVYEKFGFVTCSADAHLSLQVRNVERVAGGNKPAAHCSVRSFSQDDLPAMVNLYNEEHARRPWTHERAAGWNGLVPTQMWRPGSEVIVLEGAEGLAGYAIFTEQPFGHTVSPFVVVELAARDVEAARALLVEVAARCWKMRFSEFQVREPLDSAVGKAARELGCGYHQSFPPSGRMMGAILDRPGLLSLLEPELRRRLPGEGLSALHAQAFEALRKGEIVSDDQALLRLLLGYWSLDHALALGMVIPAGYERVCEAWFPGGGTKSLLLPHAHHLDRY